MGFDVTSDHPVRFGVVESLNTTIKGVLRRARGMRYEAMLLLKLNWAALDRFGRLAIWHDSFSRFELFCDAHKAVMIAKSWRRSPGRTSPSGRRPANLDGVPITCPTATHDYA